MTKMCSKCLEDLPLDEFYRQPAGKFGRRSRCKKCFSAEVTALRVKPEVRIRINQQARARKRPAEQQLRYDLARFGMTSERYDEILAEQNGRCAICKSACPVNQSDRFSIDHDHRCCPARKGCGKCVRGLLCGRCNVMLGMALDNPETLRAAAIYLESTPALFAALGATVPGV